MKTVTRTAKAKAKKAALARRRRKDRRIAARRHGGGVAGKAIQQPLVIRGKTIPEIATGTKLTSSYLLRCTKGSRTPTVGVLRKLRDFCGFDSLDSVADVFAKEPVAKAKARKKAA
jgi:hypothetical protein